MGNILKRRKKIRETVQEIKIENGQIRSRLEKEIGDAIVARSLASKASSRRTGEKISDYSTAETGNCTEFKEYYIRKSLNNHIIQVCVYAVFSGQVCRSPLI